MLFAKTQMKNALVVSAWTWSILCVVKKLAVAMNTHFRAVVKTTSVLKANKHVTNFLGSVNSSI